MTRGIVSVRRDSSMESYNIHDPDIEKPAPNNSTAYPRLSGAAVYTSAWNHL